MTEITQEKIAELSIFIRDSDYETLLKRWRFSESGDPIFQQRVLAEYYQERMTELREEIGYSQAAAISKSIGWKRDAQGVPIPGSEK